MPSKVSLGLLLLSAAMWPAPAKAQDTSTLQRSDFTIKLQRPDGDTWVDLTAVAAEAYLGQARCLCDSPLRVRVQLDDGARHKLAVMPAGTYARLYLGANCASLDSLNQPSCPDGLLAQMDGLETFTSTGTWTVETTASRLFSGLHDACTGTGTTTIWLWLDSTGRGRPDDRISGSDAPRVGFHLDGTPPDSPAPDTVVRADKSLLVFLDYMAARNTPDVTGFLVFCMAEGGKPVYDPGFYNGQYKTGFTECGINAPVPATEPTSNGNGRWGVEVTAPQAFQDLDPRFLCSDLLPPDRSTYSLSNLRSGVRYTVGVAAVDLNGNASPIRKSIVQMPAPATATAPDATGIANAGTPRLGDSGCDCHLARPERKAILWVGMLLLPLACRLRGRGPSKPPMTTGRR